MPVVYTEEAYNVLSGTSDVFSCSNLPSVAATRRRFSFCLHPINVVDE